jgi:hypothetical protein
MPDQVTCGLLISGVPHISWYTMCLSSDVVISKSSNFRGCQAGSTGSGFENEQCHSMVLSFPRIMQLGQSERFETLGALEKPQFSETKLFKCGEQSRVERTIAWWSLSDLNPVTYLV